MRNGESSKAGGAARATSLALVKPSATCRRSTLPSSSGFSSLKPSPAARFSYTRATLRTRSASLPRAVSLSMSTVAASPRWGADRPSARSASSPTASAHRHRHGAARLDRAQAAQVRVRGLRRAASDHPEADHCFLESQESGRLKDGGFDKPVTTKIRHLRDFSLLRESSMGARLAWHCL